MSRDLRSYQSGPHRSKVLSDPHLILECSAGNGETRLTKSATKMTLSSSLRIEGFRFEDENEY